MEVIRIGNNTAKEEVAFETIEGSAKHKEAYLGWSLEYSLFFGSTILMQS